MTTHIIKSLLLTLACVIIFAVIYPLSIWAIAQAVPAHGKVEMVEHNGKIVGAKLIAQKFDDSTYFWSRPSAVGYNAASSGGSNKGATNPDYLKDVDGRIAVFQKANPTILRSTIPAEMVTASGSGLDPDISIEAAKVQVERIAANRHISATQIMQLIDNQTDKPLLGLFGTTKVNVLQLNIALLDLK